MRFSAPFFIFPAALVLAFAGCTPKAAAPQEATPVAAPQPAVAGPRVIDLIPTGDQIKFTTKLIEAKPNEELKIVLKNSGTNGAMVHNFILLDPETDIESFAQAAAAAKATDYFPPDYADGAIVHSKTVGPGQTVELVFKAPATPGKYEYLCSYPGHYLIGMRGVLEVK